MSRCSSSALSSGLPWRTVKSGRSALLKGKGKFAETSSGEHNEASVSEGYNSKRRYFSSKPVKAASRSGTPLDLSRPPLTIDPRALMTSKPKIPEIVRTKPPPKVWGDVPRIRPDEDIEQEYEEEEKLTTTTKLTSLLYTAISPPPLSALAAFANRLALSTRTPEKSLATDLALLEQCLIHESFWQGVEELDPVFDLSPDTRQYTHYHDKPLGSTHSDKPAHISNNGLAALGNCLLGVFATELLATSFPNLPTRVSKASLTMYSGPRSLAAVVRSWGVSPSKLELALVGNGLRHQSQEYKTYGHLRSGVGYRSDGSAPPPVGEREHLAAAGLLRWNRTKSNLDKDALLLEDALASVARAIVGAMYQKYGFGVARDFCQSHFFARLIPSPDSLAPPVAAADIIPLLKFNNPTRILVQTLKKYGMEGPKHRLLKESGRLSSHSTFLTGVFSGSQKIGEGFGSSIKMSDWRASEDALRRLYLGGRSKLTGLPSDSWAGPTEGFVGITMGDVEVPHESKS